MRIHVALKYYDSCLAVYDLFALFAPHACVYHGVFGYLGGEAFVLEFELQLESLTLSFVFEPLDEFSHF